MRSSSHARSGRVLGLAGAATLMACLALPAFASAATPEWRVGGSPVASSKIVEWASPSTVTIGVTNYPIVNRIEIQCNSSGKGTVAPKGEGEFTKWTLSGCEAHGGCQGSATAEAVNLPWHTQLAYLETKVRDRFGGGTGGEPKIKFKCTSNTLGPVSDETGSLNGKNEMEMVTFPPEKGVWERFVGLEEIGCTTGFCYLEGQQKPVLQNGGELTVK